MMNKIGYTVLFILVVGCSTPYHLEEIPPQGIEEWCEPVPIEDYEEDCVVIV
tara:strand:+ start:345 stop:500 length:156 start_codon:yes stop_codon:yes gene_type:complete